MEDREPKDRPAEPPAVLGSLGGQPYDTELTPPAPPEAEPLRLPRGGLAALRRTGGLHPARLEIVVFRNGRTLVRERGAEHAGHATLAHLVELHHLLDTIDFPALPGPPERPRPDAFFYEIAARVGRRLRVAEAEQGAVPEPLAPLIHALLAFVP